MLEAASSEHIEIVKLCKIWGADDFDRALQEADSSGHADIVKLCEGWGAERL